MGHGLAGEAACEGSAALGRAPGERGHAGVEDGGACEGGGLAGNAAGAGGEG